MHLIHQNEEHGESGTQSPASAMNKKKRLAMNLIVSVFAQIINLALGLLLPRFILVSWGSEYNGLINSVTVIMRYLAILEAGISTSALQALYKSLGHSDYNETSIIVKTSQDYYKKISRVYAMLVIGISFIYPLFLQTTISYMEIAAVIFLQGLVGVINFEFRAAYQQLIKAEGRQYIISIITLITNLLTYSAKIIALLIFDNIIIMQMLGVVIVIIQAVIYHVYFKKRYGWINTNVETNGKLLENRKYYVVQQIAGLVFNSTDTLLLSIFCGLKVASVYSVYNMVYSAIVTLISMLRSSTNFIMGQAYHENITKFKRVYNLYTSLQLTVGAILTSCSVLLIKSFIGIYTSGVKDIDYNNYFAAVLFSFNILLDCARGANLSGANIAGKAPNTIWRYIFEPILNLSVSLLLIRLLDINGVLIGTFVAGLWRTIDSILYFNHKVLGRNAFKEFVFVILVFSAFLIFAVIGFHFDLNIHNYGSFAVYGVGFAAVSLLVYGALYLGFNHKELTSLKKKI